ncbi:hypothetical protein [Streptomyces sp. GC420]|nr:hypothetical protein [Streptomyces sp. GC420]
MIDQRDGRVMVIVSGRRIPAKGLAVALAGGALSGPAAREGA